MPKKILIADDEEEIVTLLTMALEHEGYTVASATHGAKVPALIQQEKPDLVVLDLMMPGLDGYSLQLRMAEDPALRGVPVIIMTALAAARSLFENSAQVKHFLKKPFEPDELLNKIKEIMNEGESHEGKS